MGSPVYGFRAPNFSIDDETLNIIRDCGYQYDSSYNSFGLHGRYGKISLNGHRKKGIALQISENFFELPISNLCFQNRMSYLLSAMSSKRNDGDRFVLPWGGGGYFRLIPYPLFRHGVQSILKKDGAYIFYMHPWEIDPEQPVVKNASAISKFKHYSNLRESRNKLLKLIDSFPECRFMACSQYLSEFAKLPAISYQL